MAGFISIFTDLCGFKKKTLSPEKIAPENQTSSLETTKREETRDDLQNKEKDYLQNKDFDDRDTNASDEDNSNENPKISLPPARKAALRETYSCNNMVLRKSMSTKKKLSASLTIQMPRSLSMAMKRDKEEDKSVRKKKVKEEKSILVRPIILGEKCRVLDEEEEDEDHKQRMPKHRIYHPRSLSSISISRTNSNIDANVVPVNEKIQ